MSSESKETVLILGAGASLAHALSYRAKHTLYHPPLDLDFFTKAQRLAEKDPVVAGSVTNVRRLSNALGQFDDPFTVEGMSLEQYFADVYYEVATERGSDAFGLFVELLHAYVQVLAATTNWMADKRGPGDLGRLLRLELRGCERLTVITFNQDLVVENVALRLPRSQGKWCLESLYGDVSLSPLFAPSDTVPVFNLHDESCSDSPPFRLLKLHGSLNWGVRSKTPEPRLATMFPPRERKIFVLDRRIYSDYQTMQGGTKRGRQTWFLWPLIVPPIYDKHRVTGMAVLDQLWSAAREAVQSCDRLILAGYSIPDADIVAAQMLRRAFVSNSKLSCVECINPDARIVEKLKSKLACRVVKLYDGIPSFLDDQATRS